MAKLLSIKSKGINESQMALLKEQNGICTKYTDSSGLEQEDWFLPGNKIRHRLDGPAQIIRNLTSTGEIQIQHLYYEKGLLHCVTGPAHTSWIDGGSGPASKVERAYWYKGHKCPHDNYPKFLEWVKENNNFEMPIHKNANGHLKLINGQWEIVPLTIPKEGIKTFVHSMSPEEETIKAMSPEEETIKAQAKAKKGHVMSEPESKNFFKLLTKDSEKAAYRTGANQGIKALKAGISKALNHEGLDQAQAAAALKFLDTEIGEMMLRAGLGYTLNYLPIPGIQNNEYAKKVSEELRVSGLSKGMDRGAEILQQFIVPSLTEVFSNNPIVEKLMTEKPKHRIPEESEIEVEIEEEAEEQHHPSMQASK